MTLHKNAKPVFFILLFFLANLYSKDVGPWKLKWAPKFQNLGAHLAPKISHKVSPLYLQWSTFVIGNQKSEFTQWFPISDLRLARSVY